MNRESRTIVIAVNAVLAVAACGTDSVRAAFTTATMPDPLKTPFLAATVAWLRWLLADDETMKPLFVGMNCGFCKETMTWKVQEKNLP